MTRRTSAFVQIVDEESDIVAGIEPALPSPASYWTIERARTAEPRRAYAPANINKRVATMNGFKMAWRAVVALGGAGLGALILWAGFVEGGSPFEEGAAILALPWGAVTLADLYLGFFLFAGVIVAFERRLSVGLAWAVPVFLLGNIWTAVWLLVRGRALAERLTRR